MGVNFNNKSILSGIYGTNGACGGNTCPDKFGCPPDRCPDFLIRRHDTKPALKVSVADCDGPLDLNGLILEVNMWAKGKLKKSITEEDTYFSLANDIGFQQVMVGDIIVMDRVRLPEYMLVTGFDEINKLIQVQRGYQSSPISKWCKGDTLRIFRIMNAPAQTEMVFKDKTEVDGTTSTVLESSYFIYEWSPEDTCLPGCYWLEFKLIKMLGLTLFVQSGNWTGPVNIDANGFPYTGTIFTDSSVQLSYDSVNDVYILNSIAWAGEYNLYSENYFTGSSYDDGSVQLGRKGETIIETDSFSYWGNNISVIPSFTDPGLTPLDFHCTLGEGVEWMRRFPLDSEGFLIKISDSWTPE